MRQQEVNMKISTEVIIALLASFAISVVLSPIIIPFLKRLKIGQTERTEGVQSHLEKAGTPTMGGLIILAYILIVDKSFLTMRIPFSDQYFDCKWITVPLVYLAVIGTVNGVNFTDGLDGLATGVTTMVAVFFTAVSIGLGGGIEPITAAVTGALLGFLLFNVYPAQVFMGDTGSLALGGFVAGAAYVLKMPWIILVVGLIYLVEVLSVMIQVTYFKKTGGKRFFKMAPIHHHFELCGWSETRVVAVFTVVTALLCLLGLVLVS